jgi:hypothetical protein
MQWWNEVQDLSSGSSQSSSQKNKYKEDGGTRRIR